MKLLYRLYFIGIFIIYLALMNGCKLTDPKIIEEGVSIELAELRNKQLRNIKYNISLQIPDSLNKSITGYELVEFYFTKNTNQPLVLDFRNPHHFIKSVKIGNKNVKYQFLNEHIIIPNKKLKSGKNIIEIEFVAGERALNRNSEYLYSLFVPDRACTAFPCFDQPSLKANFQLDVKVPQNWVVVTNSAELKMKNNTNNTSSFAFQETKPISTYLFSFVAGKFKSISKQFDDRKITMYHREDDDEKLHHNIEKIFNLHNSSIKWLEEYTQIKYPFSKFDFVIIPSFQYSGMEHPGAILYRDSRVFLEKNATIREELNRANLIAHETAHMWFGDLVTMQWFSEVWLKEVFANFMAGKIVNPQYPDVNHQLNFLVSHYPASYLIDRTKGANPIEQELDNMKNAGTLYGNIIYHKAPIVMYGLEKITGKDSLQIGLQEYLNNFKYNNATWDDLISILDNKVDNDLKSWSKSWVYESGMPNYNVQKAYNINNELQTLIFEQTDPANKGRIWNQETEVAIAGKEKMYNYTVELNDTFNTLVVNTNTDPEYIFPNSNGLSYGFFMLDSLSIHKLLHELPKIKDPVLRCSMYISLWENMLNKKVSPEDLFNSYLKSLNNENNQQNISLVLGYIQSIFWKSLSTEQRINQSEGLENLLWEKINSEHISGSKTEYLNTYINIVNTKKGINNLYKLWNKELSVPELHISEKDYIKMAYELAIRNINNINSILDEQYKRISNSERKEQFNFIRKSVSNDPIIRDSFFEDLKKETNREKEPWVIESLEYLHHPLRSKYAIKYIIPSLKLLPELQETGDIFFPKRWLDATFSGHSSIDAVMEINLFLNTHPDFPENLKNKIYQSSDLVFRASILKNE